MPSAQYESNANDDSTTGPRSNRMSASSDTLALKTAMPKRTAKKTSKRTTAQWNATSRLLRNLELPELLDLFKQLYMLSPDNAELIDSQFQSANEDKLLEEYRRKIVLEFFPSRSNDIGDPRMGMMKKLIRDYRKGTGDLPGTAELMVTFQEQGMKFTMAYGDIDARFYDSLLSGMDDLQKLLTVECPELFPVLGERLLEILRVVYGNIGWGYSDGMWETVAEIYAFHGLELQKTGDWRSGWKIEVGM